MLGKARYAREGGTWFLELSGDLRHTLGPALNDLLDLAFSRPGTSAFLIDLSAAEAIDSTCLGILARIAIWSREHGAPRPIIVSVDEDIVETLMAVRFDRLFDLRGGTGGESGSWQELTPGGGADHERMTGLVLDAHRRLSAIDEHNRQMFKDVVEALEHEGDEKG